MENTMKHSLKSPEETASFLNALCFGWTLPIFLKGAKRDLQITDLYDPLKSDESKGLGDRLEREWKKELAKAKEIPRLGEGSKKKKPKRQPSLAWALFRVLWVPYMVQGLCLFVLSVVLQPLQPVVQSWVISYFNPGENPITRSQVVLYATILILLILSKVFITQHAILRNQEIGMRVRVACCSMIYRKLLRLDLASVDKIATGRVANLISNDVARFDYVMNNLHYIWIMPLQFLVIGYVLWQFVGVIALVGIAVMIIQTMPIQFYVGRLTAKLRSKIAVKTDERVQLMGELISGIEVVKMYAWEKPFEQEVSKIRSLEVKLISISSYLSVILISITRSSRKVSLFATLITFILMGNQLTAEITFALATSFEILGVLCDTKVRKAIIGASETKVSLRRITEFLLLDEVNHGKDIQSVPADKSRDALGETGPGVQMLLLDEGSSMEKIASAPNSQIQSIGNTSSKCNVEFEIIRVSANWVHGQLPATLFDLSTKVKSRTLSMLVGPVGSGKSSLLHLLLGELSVGAGKMSFFTTKNNTKTEINHSDISISYASQDPWIFAASIRDNIIFGQPYERDRYQEVTRVCALNEDFEQLPQGDLTYAGEKGATLSGGQKVRVNLARALYRDADLYLLDDPLSAVDSKVGNHLFKECIQGFLRDKTRILVTHQLQFLPEADSVIVINRGSVKYQGTYEELLHSGLNLLDTVKLEEFDAPKEDEEILEKTAEDRDPATVVNGNDESSELPESTETSSLDVKQEEVATGEMSNHVYKSYITAGGNMCTLITAAAAFVITQVSTNASEYWITYWTNQNAHRATFTLSNDSPSDAAISRNSTRYNHQQLDSTIESQWLDEHGLLRNNMAIYVYCILIATYILSMIFRNVFHLRICMNANRNLHNSMFANLLQATMRFFQTNPSGRILNRFSKDVGTMDEQLPITMLDALQIFTLTLGTFAMVSIVNPLTIIPLVIVGGLFYVIRIYYLRTAQNIKRLEGLAKSPVFSHVSSTLDGLTTIRSQGGSVGKMLLHEFDSLQDRHTSAWYWIIATKTAFGFTLDLILCGLTTFVCFLFILMGKGNVLGGNVGLAISKCLALGGMVQFGMQQSAAVISLFTAVERILQYTNLPNEGPFKTDKPPPDTWPSEGSLVFRDVSMRYVRNKPLVLKNLNVKINPGWKVGIVGRTGAGKSSLISALFRLTGDELEGEIILDEVDTKSIGLHELRPRISIIPQEPILFSASLRYNLDPFGEYSDAQLWDSLREVKLGDAVRSLDFRVIGGGANFSVGQRQLICLARAILKNNRLLVLDEATANIDHGSDALIQNTIKRRFADYTVLTVAHRLNTVMDSDRVMVIREGRIVEFGHPHLLLQNPNGHFSRLLQQTGKKMTEKLTGIAESAYWTSPKSREDFTDIVIRNSENVITKL
ncbi:ATP-binding cassette sub-family C member 4-like [Neodiprion fabricii]|uniref:ATP-binding cassette sub-family C member 4-like n=1 Tax=Neodiprion fabricii TaxID=2872261 RepID=UPI001ED8DB43|nr:ATP-binding cassette sub-family C member 4-like [Neodiprion fabricii]